MPKEVEPQKKVGHYASTQTWVDAKCPNSWKKYYEYPQKFEKIFFEYPLGFGKYKVPK